MKPDLEQKDGPRENTDKEIWREEKGDYYSPSIHVTQDNLIGINVGGTVVIKSAEEWHRLSTNGGWIDSRISPPVESGRYWCLVSQQTDSGLSYYQWNCCYCSDRNLWTDNLLYKNVAYWMPLMPVPVLLKESAHFKETIP